MSSNKNSGVNFLQQWAEMSKNTIEKFTKANEKLQEEVMGNFSKKPTDFVSNWFETQKKFFEPAATKANDNNEYMAYFTQWFENQVEASKKLYEQAQSFWNQNPFFTQWQNGFQSLGNNPWSASFSEMLKNMSNADQKEYFKSMFNNAETFTKMYQAWLPIFKAYQEGNFSADTFKNLLKPESVKEIMDKFLGYMPNEYTSFVNYWNDQLISFGEGLQAQSKDMFNQFKTNYQEGIAKMANAPFEKWNEIYQAANNQFQFASNPFMKMLTPDANKENIETLQEIADKIAQFNLRNSEMQFMVYEKGTAAMQSFGEKLYEKLQKGESIESFMQFYTEFLNTMDSHLTELFGSENYSKLQAELSSLGFRLKNQISAQLEKQFADLPIVTRSEMDKLYKTIYEMNKNFRELSRKGMDKAKAVSEEVTKSTVEAAKSSVKVAQSAIKTATKTATKTASKATAAKKTTKK